MPLAKAQHLENIERIRAELFQLLEGMESGLDWRPDAESWSTREVLTHMLYTPRGASQEYSGDYSPVRYRNMTCGPTRNT